MHFLCRLFYLFSLVFTNNRNYDCNNTILSFIFFLSRTFSTEVLGILKNYIFYRMFPFFNRLSLPTPLTDIFCSLMKCFLNLTENHGVTYKRSDLNKSGFIINVFTILRSSSKTKQFFRLTENMFKVTYFLP